MCNLHFTYLERYPFLYTSKEMDERNDALVGSQVEFSSFISAKSLP